jgi:hypothetical protein
MVSSVVADIFVHGLVAHSVGLLTSQVGGLRMGWHVRVVYSSVSK